MIKSYETMMHYAECDGCREEADSTDAGEEEAVAIALYNGWEEVGDKLLCPKCLDKEKRGD